jgi:hypothetical protein
MPRQVHLLVFPDTAEKFRAHWALLVSVPGSTIKGKLIHVVFSDEYFLEFKRNYDLSRTRQTYHQLLLATVNDRYVKDDQANGPSFEDSTAQDALEVEAEKIPLPDAVV